MVVLEKKVQLKLDSVRKEREEAISIIEKLVKAKYGKQFSASFVGVKTYGSMASGLAIDSSDVDLAVTGLYFNGNRDKHLVEMRSLFEDLKNLKTKSDVQYIDTATIPIIKLTMDLDKIKQTLSRHVKSSQPSLPVEKSMRFLGVDITYEDQSSTVMNQYEDMYYHSGISKSNFGI